ncbi:MAG TPA: AAA family ATPase [Nitrososphaeraceae archaeon]|jgi:archaeal cell division control protein 6|nr:AAA family ATPase [Nitrososphaeraceae archaeon]
MYESIIFKDRKKLSPRYLPKEISHREKQIDLLVRTFLDIKDDPDKFPLTVIQIIGPAGIGKTSTVIKFSDILDNELRKSKINIKIVYINLKLQGGNKYAIYKYLLSCIAPELPAQGLSAEEMLRQMLDYLILNNVYSIIILDEIDYLIKISKEIGIIYDLTRLNEFDPSKKCNVKGVIFIARSTEFYEKLDEAELSSMGRAYIEFPNYTIDQVSDILIRRSKDAFQDNVIGTDIIDWIAKIVVSPIVNGDIRYALDLLSYAGNLAESEGTEKVLLDHVKKINKQIYNGITDDDIKELSKLQIIILLGIIKGLKIKNRDYIDLKEVRMQSLEIAEKYKVRKLDVEDILDDLATRKIIKIISLKKISLISSSIENLEKSLMSKIDSTLDFK